MRSLPAGFAVAVGLALILPLLTYFREMPLADFYGEWSSALCMALAATMLWPQLSRRSQVSGSLLLLPISIVLLIAVQFILGRYEFKMDWLLPIGYLWMLLLAILLGQHFRAAGQETEVADRLAFAIIMVAIFNAFAQVAQVTGFDASLQPFVILVSDRPVCTFFGNTGQSNQTATIAWLAVAGVLYLAGKGRVRVPFAASLAFVLMLSAALTASRMAWLICFFVAFMVAASRLTLGPQSAIQNRLASALTLPLGFLLATLLIAEALQLLEVPCATAAGRLADARDGGVLIRLELWRQAIMVWLTHPWIGGGAGSFFGAAYRLQPLGAHEPLDSYAHSLPMQLLAEFGLIGLGVVALLLFLSLYPAIRRWSQLSSVDGLMFSWIGVLGIHSMLEFPLWYVHFLMFFGLALGLLVRSDANGLQISVPMRTAVTTVACVALIGNVGLFLDYRKLEHTVFLVNLELQNNVSSPRLDAAIESAGREVVVFDFIATHALGLRVPISKEDLEKKTRDAERIFHRAPSAENVGRLVLLKAMAGDFGWVREQLARMTMFFPTGNDGILARIRKRAVERPADFGNLAKLIDEAEANAPPRRWH